MKLVKLMKKILLNHKHSFSMTANPDSITQRSQSAKAGSIEITDDESPDKKQRGGQEIEDMLNIKGEPQRGLLDKQPMSVMDVVKQIWTGDSYFDPEKDWKKKNEENK